MPLGNNLYRVQTVRVNRREVLHLAVLAGARLANRVEDGGLRDENPERGKPSGYTPWKATRPRSD